MTEPVELPGGTIVPIGHLAANNIHQALKARGIDAGVEAIEAAIKDEIQMMSSHFTMAFAEIEAQAQHDLLAVKHSYAGLVARAWANKWVVAGAVAAVFAVGVVIGRVL